MSIEHITFFIGLCIGICFASICIAVERIFTERWKRKDGDVDSE